MAANRRDVRERQYRQLTGKKRLSQIEKDALNVVTAGQLAGRANKSLYEKRLNQAKKNGYVSRELEQALRYLTPAQAKKVDVYLNSPAKEEEPFIYTDHRVGSDWNAVRRTEIYNWRRKGGNLYLYKTRLYDEPIDYNELKTNPNYMGGNTADDNTAYDFISVLAQKNGYRVAVLKNKNMVVVTEDDYSEGIRRGEFESPDAYRRFNTRGYEREIKAYVTRNQ